ncbi:MAG: hypothetical protein A2W85_16305 [Bacteroidetes bacterium GWF2_41_31]|nr:MAG: hypothetical protein A2W85_16305 [Bacteroidetes bacterium GWF2_41_31]OFZ07037.1 MAG: hypothetical protein A2338_01980 [Bacteroidetes bacterium RIFOXYB12_FULL_41_6]
MKIIFDSNVWRHVASPDNFPNDTSFIAFKKIKEGIKDGKIIPYISETVFTIESIRRKDRKEFISKYRPKIIFTDTIQDKSVKNSAVIQSDSSFHPGNHPILAEHLRDAISLGFRIIRCPRIAGIINPEIEDLRFKLIGDELKNFHSKLFEVGEKIESKDAGFDQIRIIGEKYHNLWFKGIDLAPDEEWGYIANAMAEWADGDSVSISIALGCNYMCTRDSATKAGNKSVFSENNLKWLKTEYGFETITPDELAKLL